MCIFLHMLSNVPPHGAMDCSTFRGCGIPLAYCLPFMAYLTAVILVSRIFSNVITTLLAARRSQLHCD